MDFSWAGIKQTVKTYWDKLSSPQKIITVLAPLLVAGALIYLIIWAGRPQYVPIFTKLNDVDAGAITAKLQDMKVDYKLADNGATIMVPQQSSAEIRLELASAGLPEESKFSFDNLDTMRLGETDSDRKLRYVLGLQNELENTLKTLSGVEDARVHIVMPEPSLFVESQKSATAAVTLKLAPNTTLSEDQVRAIANLLAGSVEGLQSENVTIVDTSGNVVSDLLKESKDPEKLTVTQYQLKQAVEEDTRKSVQSMLDRVLGTGKAVVRINAVLDFDQKKIVKQTNGPGAVVSDQSTNESTTNGTNVAGGTPGLPSNGAPTYPADSNVNSTSTKNTSTKNYQVDTTQEEQVVSPGSVKRLSVSVMADADAVTQDQLDQIKAIVASAAGVDAARGDEIQVAAIPFNKTDLQQEVAAMENAKKQQLYMIYAGIGAAVLAGLVFLIVFLRRRSKKAKAEKMLELEGSEPVSVSDAELLMAQKLAEEEAKMNLAQKNAKSVEEIERQQIKEAVELYARNNPDEAARLMKTWLSEER
ncbi:flagellar basal-body M-ring protein/flagellar hook-basal body protein FliF [Desulfosporosinus orientis DSM 765]|uniref:Flagellar M-ring protein n=1 Tax=Desulfosporosinus orientis (strain ATCC 19365 / DSM 765 / NCIMB 8382 / VKM B-1628 / Singapore I) TaxID=768706 RepID=G7WHZ4_DESOD|nr:flagellar basal-body MS-ring/collar protein FliF [Desulfosporosinus orientis]AET70291.1 flagellar basal-body M-ring protein/flagellar hook-basal body protein FliF [Desulfosporosinus orientis DSM 765]